VFPYIETEYDGNQSKLTGICSDHGEEVYELDGREFFDDQFRKFTEEVYEMKAVTLVAWLAVRGGGAGAWKKRRAFNDSVDVFTNK